MKSSREKKVGKKFYLAVFISASEKLRSATLNIVVDSTNKIVLHANKANIVVDSPKKIM